jgi:hypothetical protein
LKPSPLFSSEQPERTKAQASPEANPLSCRKLPRLPSIFHFQATEFFWSRSWPLLRHLQIHGKMGLFDATHRPTSLLA